MNQPTPAPLPGGELATSARREGPLLGGDGGGFMVPIHVQFLEVFPFHELDDSL